MKTNFTFDELSKIFAYVSKIENAAENQIAAEKAYNEKGDIFDEEFKKYGYTFFGAPEELHTMFDEKCAAMDKRDKAARKAFNTIKEFAALVEIGGEYSDWVEDEIKNYINQKWYFNVEKVAERCKYIARQAATKIRG